MSYRTPSPLILRHAITLNELVAVGLLLMAIDIFLMDKMPIPNK